MLLKREVDVKVSFELLDRKKHNLEKNVIEEEEEDAKVSFWIEKIDSL